MQLLGGSWYMVALSRRVRSDELRKSALDVRYLTMGTLAAAAITLGIGSVAGAIAALPGVVAYVCAALTAGRYASTVAMARREIGLAEAVIVAEAEERR
jgi:hypothetical protein